ncbi:hypothetical protein ACFQV2_13310 [Actinokineospora soli]|uniref:Uncharacterized protein n=1 Tax=Actinokineospora soli TaxID=1048753 RepID=A0ABW2TKT1_9PSEU
MPLLSERGDFATSRLLVADALTGNAPAVIATAGRFLDAWERAGRPHAPDLAPAASAVAMVHGLRGDTASRAHWSGIVTALGVTAPDKAGYGTVFDAIVLLHHGRAAEAAAATATDPSEMDEQVLWIWRHWYVALRAEAAALAGSPDARALVASGRAAVAGNPSPPPSSTARRRSSTVTSRACSLRPPRSAPPTALTRKPEPTS